LLIENMLEQTVVLQGVYDAILTGGVDVKNIHFNPKLIASVRQLHAVYKAALLAKQQKEQLKIKEEKKRKAPISSLQQQNKIKMQEIQRKLKLINKLLNSNRLNEP